MFFAHDVDLNNIWIDQKFWAILKKFRHKLQKKWISIWYWNVRKYKQLFSKIWGENKEILTQIVKEIQFDRNMCDPNSYCFLPIEFSIQEIENVENFQSGEIFGSIYKTTPFLLIYLQGNFFSEMFGSYFKKTFFRYLIWLMVGDSFLEIELDFSSQRPPTTIIMRAVLWQAFLVKPQHLLKFRVLNLDFLNKLRLKI